MHEYTVAKNALISPTVRLITLELPENDNSPMLYEPGQYAAISLHDNARPTTTRCFSIVSSPLDRRVLQFAIRCKGHFTSALERLEEGDTVTVRGPFGSFVLDDRDDTDLAFFAGGIGVAPFVGILRYASERQDKRAMHLVYSCRSEGDVPFYDELVQLARKNGNIELTFVFDEGPTTHIPGVQVLRGNVCDIATSSANIDFARTTFMLCGPGGYMKALTKAIHGRGVPYERIITEAFSQSPSGHGNLLSYWPNQVYVATALTMVASTGLIVAADLIRTLPETGGEVAAEQPATEITEEAISKATVAPAESILDIPPTIEMPETKLIEKTSVEPVVSTPVVVQEPVPVVAPTPAPVVAKPAPAPVVTPTPTKQTTSKPKSRVS